MQLLHCVKIIVIVVVDHLHGLALVLVFYLLSSLTPSPLLLPPGSEASLGNSLNTSEEELHTAGITLAPKGTRGSHQPISIQIALVLAVITITFAQITITATQKPLYIRLGALLFLHNKAPAAVTVTSSAPHSLQTSRRGYLCCYVMWREWLRCV